MKYISTRGDQKKLSGAQAIIQGIAPDRGLYVPEEVPEMPFAIKDMVGKSYKEFAKAVIGTWFDDFSEDEIAACVDGAYDSSFEAEDVVPVVHAAGADFLELYHGRTSAFKDMALSILPYLMSTSMKSLNEDRKVCILTATSGDTGKAALAGFTEVPGTEIIVFYPENGVSQIQRQQMVTQTGNNVHVFAIKGNFDDAQTGVKNIFSDKKFNEKLSKNGVRLSSANSINIGRLVPQITYYIYGYAKLVENGRINDGDKVNVTVPTGNFGNILAAYYAKQMGLPINKLICASNENRVLTDFINTGRYDINRNFHLTNSPSMDILISSNLERLLYHLSGGDTDYIAGLMDSLDKNKEYKISDKVNEALSVFSCGSCNQEETLETISKIYKEDGYLMDTHTAVAYKVYNDYVEETKDKTPVLIASTASAYKFAKSVSDAIGLPEEENGFRYIDSLNKATEVRIPSNLKDLETKEVLHKDVIEIDSMESAVSNSLLGK